MDLRRILPAALCVVGAASKNALRGWNSWDSYLGNPNETETLAIAQYMADVLLPFGFDVLTVDEGWYDGGGRDPSLDAWGRPTPYVAQYPSAADGRGFFNLSSKVHDLGLRFGAWTVRGIPRAAVAAKTPIEGSPFTADEAASPVTPCNWSSTCYGCATVPEADGTLRCNSAAYAYYRSLARWYVAQGIDVVKMDCMFPAQHYPQGSYDADDWAITQALREVGLIISLSPGRDVSIQNGTWVASTGLADQYRVTEDFWDSWEDEYTSGLRSKLDVAVEFAALFGANATYPDLDMLPIGRIMSHQSPPLRPSNLTADEQRLALTLWCATGAPLIVSARLPLLPSEANSTLALLTNAGVLGAHNASHARRPLSPACPAAWEAYAWTSIPDARPGAAYVSLFNGGDAAHEVPVNLADVFPGGAPGVAYCARDVWASAPVPGGPWTTAFAATLRPHAAGMFLLEPC